MSDKKEERCESCRYCLHVHEVGHYVCHREKSAQFGRFINEKGSGCEQHQRTRYDMPLKEALEAVTRSDGLCYMPRRHEGDTPCLYIWFDDNEELADHRDALIRLFEEFIDISTADGSIAADDLKQ